MAEIVNIRTVSVPSIGKLPLAEDPGSFTPSGTKRDHRPGRLSEDGGFIETSTPAKLELNINLLTNVDVTALNAIKNQDVTIRLSSGEVHMMGQAYSAEPIGVENGNSKLVLMSNTSERIA